MSLILAIDQGTSRTTCLVCTPDHRVIGRGYAAVSCYFPRPGWVEQDPGEIWTSVVTAAGKALLDARLPASSLTVVAIATQRETTVLWDRQTDQPVANAIVWQDRRTAARCRMLDRGIVRERTGLIPDPYFSATKLEWLLRAGALGDLAFGTVDSWIIWRLSGGRTHATDVTNASRTMLMNINTLEWDDRMLEEFSVERQILPVILDSSGSFGPGRLLGASVEIRGVSGDQPAALFGSDCRRPGETKATLGTGTAVLSVADGSDQRIHDGLLMSRAIDGYAMEGPIFASGAAVSWLVEGLGVIQDPRESAALAAEVPDTAGVTFIPALAGLGAPWWDASARGTVTGLTSATSRAHLVRATLEAIAHQIADVVDVLPHRPQRLLVDGGGTSNVFTMQFLADLLELPVEISAEREMTALGAAAVALGRPKRPQVELVYEPNMAPGRAAAMRTTWKEVVTSATRSSRSTE